MRRTAITMIVVGALIFALTAATALAAPGKGGGKGKAKVTMCHEGQTITTSSKAVKGHQKHGDTMGACAATTTPAPAPAPEPAPAPTPSPEPAPAA